MKKMIVACAAALAVFTACAQESTPVEREKPRMTANQVVDYSNQSYDRYSQGYADGHIVALTMMMDLLQAYGVIRNGMVCLPSQYTYEALRTAVRDKMRFEVNPTSGVADADGYDAIVSILMAVTKAYPCR